MWTLFTESDAGGEPAATGRSLHPVPTVGVPRVARQEGIQGAGEAHHGRMSNAKQGTEVRLG